MSQRFIKILWGSFPFGRLVVHCSHVSGIFWDVPFCLSEAIDKSAEMRRFSVMSSQYHSANFNNNNYYNYNYYSNSPGPSPGPGPGSPPPRRGGNRYESISWVIDIALIFLVNIVGLLLTVLHVFGIDVVGGLLRRLSTVRGSERAGNFSGMRDRAGRVASSVRKKAGQAGAAVRERAGRAGAASPSEPNGQTDVTAEAIRRPDAGSTVRKVFGWILAVFGALAAVNAAVHGRLWNLLTTGAVLLGGATLALSGHVSDRKAARFRRCLTVCGEQGIIRMERLSLTLGMSRTDTLRMLEEMLDRGYFGQRAYLDHQRGLLVVRPEEMRDVYRAEDKAKAAQPAQQDNGQSTVGSKESASDNSSEYDRWVAAIGQANEEIRDPVMSEKIRRMQAASAAIFREVEEHPSKRSQINRFMNYYLPTTLKLLQSYAHIESQGVSGENMAKAKKDIEGIMDTLAAGYEKQLDNLYQADAVDIAGDVQVIERMMQRDGLTEEDDFGLKAGGS